MDLCPYTYTYVQCARVVEDLHRVRRAWRRAAAGDATVTHGQRARLGVHDAVRVAHLSTCLVYCG